jgi:hypothetical protein
VLTVFVGQRFRAALIANKQINLRALDNTISHAIRNVAQLLQGQRRVAWLREPFRQSFGQAKSAIGKRNKTGWITLCVEKDVPAGPAPIEIFDHVAYRVDYPRISVFEYLLDASERFSSFSR